MLRFRRNHGRIVAGFGLPFYEIEARDAMVAPPRGRLVDDPQTYRLAGAVVEEQLDRLRNGNPTANFGEVKAIWPGKLALGMYQPEVWRLGAEIASRDGSRLAVDSAAPFRADLIYCPNHDAYELRAYLTGLLNGWMIATVAVPTGGEEADRDAIMAKVLCPMCRVGRLHDAACADDPAAGRCNLGGWGADVPGRVRRVTKGETASAWERTAAIEELMFAPVPVEVFLRAPVEGVETGTRQ